MLAPSKVVELSEYWKEGSKEDLESARVIIYQSFLFAPGLFFLHLSLEKALKHYYVLKFNVHAPFSQNLISLVEVLNWDIDVDLSKNLSEINQFIQ